MVKELPYLLAVNEQITLTLEKLRFTSNKLKETLRHFFHQLASRVFYSCIDIFLSSSVERSNYVVAKRTQPTSFKNYIPRSLVSLMGTQVYLQRSFTLSKNCNKQQLQVAQYLKISCLYCIKWPHRVYQSFGQVIDLLLKYQGFTIF